MTAPGWYNEGKKLEEGKVYRFRFVKTTLLSDGQDYMVFEDPYAIRHLIPFDFYRPYGLQPDSEVRCLVDRINCTGRVFLEPQHPHYTVGEVYYFRIVETRPASGEELTDRLVVSDVFGNKIVVTVPDTDFIDKSSSELKCEVVKIRKGVPELRPDAACTRPELPGVKGL
jgi:hypothetical protein